MRPYKYAVINFWVYRSNRNPTDIRNHVGANLVFALRTKTVIKPMFENELETFAFGHRFANDW
jgi:hypothetical protein